MRKVLLSIFLLIFIFGCSIAHAATYNLTVNNGSASRQEKVAEGTTVGITAAPPSGYVLNEWTATGITLTNAQKIATTISFVMPSNNVVLTASFQEEIQVPVNKPNLLDGMVPVKWNGSNWVITNEDDVSWYNYSSDIKKWANVMLRDNMKYMNNGVSTAVGSTSLSSLNGKTVDSSNLGSMFVWIPRYTYLINGSNVSVKFSNGLADDTSGGYIVQPAFNFASYNGGSTSNSSNYQPAPSASDMLKGFWAAKYPATNNGGYIAINGGTEWTNLSISTVFSHSKAMIASQLSHYGINVDDAHLYNSHLMKNVEWGAVSYLAKAIGNTSNTSTTGNQTGVYGMNSGKEFVASYIELVGGITNYNVRANGANLLDYTDSNIVRYIDKLKLESYKDDTTQNAAKLDEYDGLATDLGSGTVPNKKEAFFVRGNSSIFDYLGATGAADSSISFRPTIIADVDNVFTVIYNANGGTGAPASQTKAEGEILTLSSTAPTLTGSTFLGWATTTTAISPEYYSGGIYVEDRSVTLYAVWKALPYTVTTTVEPTAGGSVVGAGTYVTGSTVPLIAIANPGYTFTGWTVVSGGVTLGSTTNAITSFTMPANNVSIKATFTANTYTITYELNGGSATNRTSYTIATETFELSNPTRTGYTFAGWTGTGLSEKTETVTIAKGSTGNRAYIANWTALEYELTVNPGSTKYKGGYQDTQSVKAPTSTYTITYNYNGNGDANTVVNATRPFSSWTLSGSGSVSSTTESSTTYTFGAGNGILTASYNSTANSVTLPTPSRNGYTFNGWYTAAEGGTKVGNGGASYSATANITLYAQWSNYAVTVTADPAVGGTVSGSGYYAVGDTVPIAAIANAGYAFTGWTVVSGGVTLGSTTNASTTFTMPASNVSIKATFTANTYTITYELNGGSVSGTNPTSYNVTSNAITLINPTRTGYTFAGWTGTGLSSASTSVTIAKGSTGNRSYTANWAEDPYRVTLTADPTSGGNVSGAGQYALGKTVSIAAIANEGYTFTGWTVVSGGVTLGSTTNASTTFTMPSNDVSIKATFTANTYTITYELNDDYPLKDDGTPVSLASVSPANPTSYTIATETFTLSNPTRTGYTFAGWTGTGLSSASTSVTISKGSTGDRAYTANWTPVTYTISYDLAGGSATNPTSYTIETATFTLSNPTKTGYTFAGWTGTGLDSSSTSVTISKGSTRNRTYTATWTQDTYTITYELNDDYPLKDDGTTPVSLASVSPANPTSYTVETETFELSNPTRTGYTFIGWTGTGLNEKTITVTIAKGSTGDRAYTANWTPDTYTISYRLGGGIATNLTSYTIETPTFTLSNPVQTGYTFDGWVIGGSSIQSTITIEKGSTEDRTYVAYWSPITYTITYELNGGSVSPSNPEEYTVATETFTLTNPTRTGYTFTGWIGTGLSSETTSVTISKGSVGDRIYIANWSRIGNEVTITKDPSEGGTTYGDGTYGYGDTVRIVAIPNEGYSFTGWEIVSGLTTLNNDDVASTVFSMPANDVTIKAIFTPNYTITVEIKSTLDYGGIAHGTVNVSGSVTQEMTTTNEALIVLSGGNLAFTATADTGYNIGAVYLDGEEKTLNQVNNALSNITSDHTVTIYINANTYLVSYNSNNGSGSMAASSAYYGIDFTIPECTFTAPAGKAFTSWNTSANPASVPGTSYAPGDTVTFTSATTLYAQWAQIYTVTFNAGRMDAYFMEGTQYVYEYEIEVVRGGTAVCPSTPIRYAGETFKGWGTDYSQSSSSVSYTGLSIPNVMGDMTLYPKFE